MCQYACQYRQKLNRHMRLVHSSNRPNGRRRNNPQVANAVAVATAAAAATVASMVGLRENVHHDDDAGSQYDDLHHRSSLDVDTNDQPDTTNGHDIDANSFVDQRNYLMDYNLMSSIYLQNLAAAATAAAAASATSATDVAVSTNGYINNNNNNNFLINIDNGHHNNNLVVEEEPLDLSLPQEVRRSRKLLESHTVF